MPWLAAIGAGVAAGAGSAAGGKKGAAGARDAASVQAEATLESTKIQSQMAEKGFNIFADEADKARDFLSQQTKAAKKELEPIKELGMANLSRLSDFAADPNSDLAQANRAQFQKVLAQNLSARGLTASGTEFAGLSDFELGLLRERNAVSQGLAGMGTQAANTSAGLTQQLGQGGAAIHQGLGSGAASLFGGLGGNMGAAIQAGASGVANATLAGAQFQAQGLAGLSNAFQGALGGVGQYYGQQQQNQFLTGLLGGGGGGGGGGFNAPSFGGFDLGFGGNYGF